jgi:hypothetical protein
MRQLIGFALASVIALSIGCGAARAVGYQQPIPPRVDILHLTYCALPCWIGIEPGITTMVQAEQRLLDVYEQDPAFAVARVPDELLSYEITVQGAPQTRLVITLVGSPIQMITIATLNHPAWGHLTLGDIFAIYGEPSGVATDNPLYVLMGNSSDQLMIPVAVQTYGTTQPKHRLIIDETVSMLVFYHSPRNQVYSRWSRWQGFTNLQPRYLPFITP